MLVFQFSPQLFKSRFNRVHVSHSQYDTSPFPGSISQESPASGASRHAVSGTRRYPLKYDPIHNFIASTLILYSVGYPAFGPFKCFDLLSQVLSVSILSGNAR